MARFPCSARCRQAASVLERGGWVIPRQAASVHLETPPSSSFIVVCLARWWGWKHLTIECPVGAMVAKIFSSPQRGRKKNRELSWNEFPQCTWKNGWLKESPFFCHRLVGIFLFPVSSISDDDAQRERRRTKGQPAVQVYKLRSHFSNLLTGSYFI